MWFPTHATIRLCHGWGTRPINRLELIYLELICGQMSERDTTRNQTVLVGLAFETLTEVGMRDGDDRHGSLCH